MMSTEGNVKLLAKNISELEETIKSQRRQLSRRLKAIYILGDEGVVRVLFSSASAQDLDQSIKYLKLISEHDFDLLKAYAVNLRTLTEKRNRMKNEVRGLLTIKERFNYQEQLLSRDQEQKAKILSSLDNQKNKSIENLAKIRSQASTPNESSVFNISFYEQRGHLRLPLKNASLVQNFGMNESPDFHYRLSHKGFGYKSKPGLSVQTVYNGKVAFVGEIQGYGASIVVDHGDHYYTVYTQLKSALVAEGQNVKSGENIALSSGEFYFEIRHFSDAIDPKNWLADI
jgi:septal ring factor EnvC (AmiA/AmiB activator)